MQSPAPVRNLLSEEPKSSPHSWLGSAHRLAKLAALCRQTLPSSLTWASSHFNCLALDGSLEGTSQGPRTTPRSRCCHQFFFSYSSYRTVGRREF